MVGAQGGYLLDSDGMDVSEFKRFDVGPKAGFRIGQKIGFFIEADMYCGTISSYGYNSYNLVWQINGGIKFK